VATPELSVVVISKNEGARLRETVENLLATATKECEIVVVDDQSEDDSAAFLNDPGFRDVKAVRTAQTQGIARARNLGAGEAAGEILVFSDAHNTVSADWPTEISDALTRSGVGAVGPRFTGVTGTSAFQGFGMTLVDHSLKPVWIKDEEQALSGVPILGGGFFCTTRAVAAHAGLFDPGMGGLGFEDVELSLRLWARGYRCEVVPSVTVAHLFRAAPPYPVDKAAFLENLFRLAALHLPDSLLPLPFRWAAHQPTYRHTLGRAFARFEASDIRERSAWLDSLRVHDRAWVFDRFDMPLSGTVSPERIDALLVGLG
jgi:GT2 family glycosyltransferase